MSLCPLQIENMFLKMDVVLLYLISSSILGINSWLIKFELWLWFFPVPTLVALTYFYVIVDSLNKSLVLFSCSSTSWRNKKVRGAAWIYSKAELLKSVEDLLKFEKLPFNCDNLTHCWVHRSKSQKIQNLMGNLFSPNIFQILLKEGSATKKK